MDTGGVHRAQKLGKPEMCGSPYHKKGEKYGYYKENATRNE